MCALAATHYRSSPSNHLESLFPIGEVPNAGGTRLHECPLLRQRRLAVSRHQGRESSEGRPRLRRLRNGTSKVAIITESREEELTSWYSGLATYVVAAMPPPNGADPVGVDAAGRFDLDVQWRGELRHCVEQGGSKRRRHQRVLSADKSARRRCTDLGAQQPASWSSDARLCRWSRGSDQRQHR